MGSLRDIRRRINSVKNTRKITRAMKLVAAAKMNKAQIAAKSAQPYQEAIKTVLGRVISSEDSIEHELLTIPSNDKNVVLVALSSDRGLCASFNSQIIKHVIKLAKGFREEGKTVQVLCYGKKIAAGLKNEDIDIIHSEIGLKPADFSKASKDLAERLVTMLKDEQFEKAVLCYNKFFNIMIQEPGDQQVLPMELDDSASNDTADYLYEPSGKEILGELLPLNLRSQLLQAFLDTEAGEQAARMQSMDNATRNAGDMIDRLSLQYNRARQAAITTELTEIISGAEAL
jgi:F-type H+-transporting ATPase subunit gamma